LPCDQEQMEIRGLPYTQGVIVVLAVPDANGRVHFEACPWGVTPASNTNHLGLMLSSDSKALGLIEAGAKRVGINLLSSLEIERRFRSCDDEPLFIRQPVEAYLCAPEYAFRPHPDYTHCFTTFRVLQKGEEYAAGRRI